MANPLGNHDPIYDLSRIASGLNQLPGGGSNSSSADANYLRLDTTNDPLTGPLDIKVNDANALRVLTEGTSGVYSFPVTPILDTFPVDGGPPPDANWTTPATAESGLVVDSGKLSPLTGTNLVGQAVWSPLSGLTDTEVYVDTVANPAAIYANIALFARIQDPDDIWAGSYGLYFTYNPPDPTTFFLGTFNAGRSFGTAVNFAWALGDSIGLYVKNLGPVLVLRAYHKPAGGSWSMIASSASIPFFNYTSGKIGIEVEANDKAPDAFGQCDNFGGGAIPAGQYSESIFNVDTLTHLTTAERIEITQPDGLAPLVVTSETLNTHFNADLLDNKHGAAYQLAGNYITALTGDVTATGPGSVAATLKNTGPGATGPLGSATVAPIITIDAQGRVTALSSAAIAFPAPGTGTITPAMLQNADAQYRLLTSGATPFAFALSGYQLDGTAGGKTVLAVTSGKTLTLTAADNYNVTIPATGTVALLGTANVFTADQQLITGKTFIFQDTSNTRGVSMGIRYDSTGSSGTYIGFTPTVANQLGGFEIYPNGSGNSSALLVYGGGTPNTGNYQRLEIISRKTGGADIQQKSSGAGYTVGDLSIICSLTTKLIVSQTGTGAGIATVAELRGLGSGANGDGGSILMAGKSSTAASQNMGSLQWLWNVATHASAVSDLVLSAAYNNSSAIVTSEFLRGRGGASPLIGFLGAAPVVRPSSTTDLRTALIDLGLYTTGGASPLNLNGGLLQAGMVRQSDTWHAYGGFQLSTTTIACTLNTWAWITNAGHNLWVAIESSGVTVSGDVFTAVHTGDYTGQVTVSITGTNGRDFFIRVFNITTNAQMGYTIGATTTGSPNFTPITLPLYMELTAGDTFRFEIENITDNADPDVRSAVYNILYVHD